ncbi:MAG: tetratricopeptide repeat protein [Bacteroidota bacterium]|nr:tetratricopeptide repeat protein [Bacteroidota bacterium]
MNDLTKLFFIAILCLGLTAGQSYGQSKRQRKKADKAQTEVEKQVDPLLADARQKEAGESFFVDGVKYLLLEEYDKALERFQRAYALNPNNAALNYKLAETHMLAGRVNDALPFAQAAVTLDASNPYYYLLLAQLYSGGQKYDEAIKVLTKLTKDIPGTEQYLFNLADLYLAKNRFDDALKTYERIEKQYGFIEEVSFKRQQIYLKQNNLDKALKEGEALIASDPTEVRYPLAQAEVLANNKKIDQAIQFVNKALTIDQNNAQARLMLAELLRQKGQVNEAVTQLHTAFGNPGLDIDAKVKILIEYIRQLPQPASKNQALLNTTLDLAEQTLKAHPQEAKAYAVAADIQNLANKKTEARNNYIKAVHLDNSHFSIWNQLVALDAELNQTDSLLVHTEKALELFPNQAVFWFYNGTSYLFKKNYARAVKSLEYGKKLSLDKPELVTQFNLRLGDSYNSLKDYAKSDEAYEAVLAQDPNNPQVLNNYSYYLSLRSQNLAKAKALSSKLVALFPNDETYLDTHAWVLYKLKDYPAALKFFEKIGATTKNGTIAEHYGDVLYQLGQKEKAVQQWQRAKTLGEASEFIDKKIKDQKLYE